MASPERLILDGRYAVYQRIASGGMAAVHLGRTLGAAGFSRVVAIKRMHPHLLEDAAFESMFIDEARLAARIRHPNVVQTLDVVRKDRELFVVMEYVHGESLSRLMRTTAEAEEKVPPGVACAVACGLLHGLHAAHEARTEDGTALEIVHRDVSPQNVLVGADGLARVLDFGIAKAAVRLQTTRTGEVKGKFSYMAPEQLRAGKVTRQADVYSAAVVLWEMLTARRLFVSDVQGDLIEQILVGMVDPPSNHVPGLPPAVDDIVLRGLSPRADARFSTAKEMAEALQAALPPALPSEVAAWVERRAGAALQRKASELSEVERDDTAIPVEVGATMREGREGGRSRVAALLAGAALMAIAGVSFGLSRREPPQTAASPAPPATTIAPPVVSASPPSRPPPSPPPAATPEPPPSPSPPAASTVAATPSVRAVRPRPRPPADDCTPPYTVSADGARHYKRQCLQ